MEFKHNAICKACQKEKSNITSLRSKDMFEITEPLQKTRMDFYGLVNVMSTSSINSLK